MEPAEIIGQPCCQLFHGTKEPTSGCPHLTSLATGEVVTTELFEPLLGIHLEVTTSPLFDEKGETIASVHVARDVTERKKMDEQLIIADRLASIGELASGIAHELNNPLTSVIGFSQLLLKKNIPDDIREDLNIIVSEAQRGAEVVRNLLTFARNHAPVKDLVNLNDIIVRVLKLREYEQRVSNIQVNTRLAHDLPLVMGGDFQLQQVFLNIILNAEYFMCAAHKRGTLTIVSQRVGDWVRVSLADDGPGISEENLGRVFDPFFTTKEVGKGTGLGLSICHGIVTGHGGRIHARSQPGQGATFIVELPVPPESAHG
jgi:signal transduction histidine kinase